MSLESALDSALGYEPAAAPKKAARRDKTLAQALDAAFAAPRPQPAVPPSLAGRIAPHVAEFFRPLTRAGQAGGEELIAGAKELQPFGRGTEGPEQVAARIFRGLGRLGSSIPAAGSAFLASPIAGTPAGEYRPRVGHREVPSVADVLRAVGQGAGTVATVLPGMGVGRVRPPIYPPGRWPGEMLALPEGAPTRALPPSSVLPRPSGPVGRYGIWTPEEAAKRLPARPPSPPAERLALPAPSAPSPAPKVPLNPLERIERPVEAPPRFEMTPEGQQAVVPGVEGRVQPARPLRAKTPQAEITETPLFGQAKAGRERAAEAAQGTLPLTGKPTAPGFRLSTTGFEHGVPNLKDPDDVYRVVQSMGRLKVTEDLAGELRDVSAFFKSGKGRTLDQMAEALADEYPGLGERGAIKEQLVDTLRRYPVLKAEKKLRAGQVSAQEAAEQRMVTEIHTAAPPGDVPVNPQEWTAMGPIQRQAAMEFFRQTLTDESGRLDLGAMGRALHRFRGRFPMETAVIKERPNSPVISEVERWNTHNADWISTIAKAPWWQGARKVNPELLKDAEAAAVAEWKANGGTAQAARAARHHFPPEIQAAMRNREGQLVHEQAARAYFGLEPIPETPGPYLPRRTIGESREAVSLGGAGFGTGRNRAIQSTVKGHGQERVFDTYRQGERSGIEYEDPRNSILLREWEGIKLRSTARLFRNLESKGGLFRDRVSAAAASPTGKPWMVENAPGGGTWWMPTEAEAKFLQQNLTESQTGPFGSFVGYANGLLRNPNLVNPLPHILKNMAMKGLLADGPINQSRLAYDAVEWARGRNPQMLREFNEAMPFAQSGKTAGHVLGEELRGGGVDNAIRQAFRTIGLVNRPSQKVIFEWADPAMRYSLFKHYRQKGFGVYEAGNHAWVDLIRYGTRADRIDFWKSVPFNFFVPWRFGTMVSLLKQVKNHPVRTALLLGAVDYLREARYRATGRWTHLPQDYTEKPIVQMLESGNPKDIAAVIGTTAIFGPGGDFSAKQLTEAVQAVSGSPNSFEMDRLKNAFWGVSQLFGPGGAADEFQKGQYGNMLAGLLLGEHAALTYQPRRLMKALPESFPLMRKSALVQQAEAMQALKQQRSERAREHRKPRSTIEDKLRAAGYLR